MKYSKMFLLAGSLFFGLMSTTPSETSQKQQPNSSHRVLPIGNIDNPVSYRHRTHHEEHTLDCKKWWEDYNKPGRIKTMDVSCRHHVSDCANYDMCIRERDHGNKDDCECYFNQSHLNQPDVTSNLASFFSRMQPVHRTTP